MRARREGAYLLYDALLYLAVVLLAPWLTLRWLLSPTFRAALPGRLGFAGRLPASPSRLLIHGVSVGEVKAARPLFLAIAEAHPGCEIVLCSTTPGGRETAERIFPGAPVTAFPVDLPGACRRFLDRIRPTGVILLELEIWPNFLRACNRTGVPVAIVNGRITERSMAGYLRVQRLLPQFDRIELYGVQNERYAERFRGLNVPRDAIVVTGNLKYDNLPAAGEEQAFRESPWPGWVAGRPALAFGSTHDPEEADLLRGARGSAVLEDCLWLVVPRHPKRAPRILAALRKEAPGRPIRLRSEQPAGEPLADGAVLVVDTFGELEWVYRASAAAFVGGSLVPHGGQNVLEPAALGKPICVGPHTENFAEEVEWLAEAGGLRRATSAPALLELLADWLRDPRSAQASGQAAYRALSARRGGASATLEALERAGLLAAKPESVPVNA